jgi:hypothetical protein
MEKIGDRETAIADRVRALLAAANSTVAAAVTPGASFSAPATPIPRDPRRLDPHSDPARVVANLTAAGIRLAVSFFFIFTLSVLCFVLLVHPDFVVIFSRLIVEDLGPSSQSCKT